MQFNNLFTLVNLTSSANAATSTKMQDFKERIGNKLGKNLTRAKKYAGETKEKGKELFNRIKSKKGNK